jgi:hypothetical protein
MPPRPWNYQSLIPKVFGLVLILAAVAKAAEITWSDQPSTNWLKSRELLSVIAGFEFVLGLWLCSGLFPATARVVGIVCFLAFAQVAIYQTVAGETTCHCFGRAKIPPIYIAIFDILAVGAFVMWVPEKGPTVSFRTHPWRLGFLAAVGLLVGLPLLAGLLRERTNSFQLELRMDRRLQQRVELITPGNASQYILLERLQTRTGVNLTVDDQLEKQPPVYGRFELQGAQACMVMELIAQQQKIPARWHKEGEGYRLSALPWWRSLDAWNVALWILRIEAIIFLIAFWVAGKSLRAMTAKPATA